MSEPRTTMKTLRSVFPRALAGGSEADLTDSCLGPEVGAADERDYRGLTVGADHDPDGPVRAVACEGDRDTDVLGVMVESVTSDDRHYKQADLACEGLSCPVPFVEDDREIGV